MANSTPSKPSILFLTNSEYGQTNVMFAVAYELLLKNEFEIHMCSFGVLRPRIETFNKAIQEWAPPEAAAAAAAAAAQDGQKLIFHETPGKSMQESFGPIKGGIDVRHPPATAAGFRTFGEFTCIWTPEQFVQSTYAIVDVIQELQPALVVVDQLFGQGLDAVRKLEAKHLILSPLSFKECAAVYQGFDSFWKFPISGSGYPYPLPWSYIPWNIYRFMQLIYILSTDPKVKELQKYRNEHGLEGPIPWSKHNDGSAYHLCCGLPELDYPYYIPDHVIGCGPILLPTTPLSQSDPTNLLKWLQKGPTILVNLGSQVRLEKSHVHEFACGLRTILDQRPDIQILWKVKIKLRSTDQTDVPVEDQAPAETGLEIIEQEIKADRVRIVSWLDADPLAILQTGHIVCSVHHGGANSTYEALASGVPHVVLPVWWDTYCFAQRMEWLGIGVWGSKSTAPDVNAKELGEALSIVVGVGNGSASSKNAQVMRQKALELAAICNRKSGRVVAADKITEVARGSR